MVDNFPPSYQREIIREDLTTEQVLAIREKERALGNHVNVRRIHSTLVEIEILSVAAVIAEESNAPTVTIDAMGESDEETIIDVEAEEVFSLAYTPSLPDSNQ